MANSFGFFLFLVLFFGVTVLVQAQQQTGFISIDCGGSENLNIDDVTKTKYSSEGSYIQTGVNRNISSEYAYPNNPTLPLPFSNLRSFPQGDQNCYRLTTGRKGSLYLIRASFLYGNYDGENKLPEFDLYVDVNFWSSVKFKNASEQVTLEIISTAQSEETNVCLLNTGKGVPFISGLELRPISTPIYNTEFGDSASLLLFKRWDIGSINGSGRYEDDVYDRIWFPFSSSSWKSLNSSVDIDVNGDGYRVPSEVMRTCSTPKNENDSLEFSWTSDDPNTKFYVYLYFTEVEILQGSQLRKFSVSWNGSPFNTSLVPKYGQATTLFNSKSLVAQEHRISIQKTEDSTLPPILNAVEIYVVRQLDALPTFEQDVEAIRSVKECYRVQRDWVADPCEPKNYTWEGLKCNYNTSLPPRIISLNLSRSSLSGIIAPAISNLTFLESLDLSNNSLSGPMPRFLEELRFLKYLNLRGNQLSGFVSTTLLERSKKGLLTLRVDDKNFSGSSNKKKVIAPIVASISSVIVLSVIAILYRKIRRRNEQSEEETNMLNKSVGTVVSKKLQYTYAEVLAITSNFQLVIGRGGFGSVYSGQMKDGHKVAVKMLSASSAQGPKEFQTEAELLMTVHHKNLVSFIGYCDEGDKMALIYEYLANGNLKDKLSEKSSSCLSWERRIQIAIDAAEGLDYLHHGCKPPIIHRDVKSANILLSENLEAKIADFGLSKVFKNSDNGNSESAIIYVDDKNEMSTIMGTMGYLDPEYYELVNLNEKSDIYSFGVVLLELITALPAVIKGKPSIHILEFVRPHLEKSDLRKIIDPRLQGKFNEDSGRKVLGLAVSCTASTSIQRPTMSVVLSKLKQCVKMESPSDREISSESYSSSDVFNSMDNEPMTYPFPR
ncbi:probable LRR receptor-like serine/threonine-protein kinase At4g29180 [Vicia villosa]|uniref:probable LRR receptor-like serine/threonine-protein kinase At4g29180 n=1 Tax=Vicia villosa TaxID=3911 RepID=UPI00273B3AE5|nr:probable LRR receptor-like serine/threonine-protein kinase At4g29180 [Vicia villosa]